MLGVRAIRREEVPALLPILALVLLLREGAADCVRCCPLTVVPGFTVLLMVRILGSGSCGAGGAGGGVGAGGSTLGGAGGGGRGVGLGGGGGA